MRWQWSQNGSGEAVPEDDRRRTMERILASRTFARSERHRRFLEFIVEEALAGRESAIKETVLASEVYQRNSSFDPQVNSLVRVEARKLRKRLDEYFANEGIGDPVRIEIPKGSYVPRFEYREARTAVPPRRLAVAAVLLAMAAVAAVPGWRYLRSVPASTGSSVAVLPFAAVPLGDAALEAFGDGLSGDVTASLARIPGLKVMPRQAMQSARKPGVAAGDLARRLGVDALVDGKVNRTGDRIRVNVELVSNAAGRIVWSGDWDRDAAGTSILYREIAQGIAHALGKAAPGVAGSAPSVAARDLYWTARYLRERRNTKELLRSVDVYRQVLGANPGYAAAWAGLSESYTDLAFHGYADYSGMIPAAREAAAKAIALDPAQGGAHASLARIHYFHDWDWRAAETEFRRALAADPESAAVHREFSLALAGRRRFEEALVHTRKAAEIDPLSTVSNYDSALILFMSGQYPACIESAQRATAVNAENHAVRALLGTCLTSAGRPREAIPHYQQALTLAQRRAFILGRLGAAHARAGDRNAAEHVLDQALRADVPGFSWICPAYVYAALGRNAAALDCLERAADARDSDFVFIGAEPLFEPLATEPRFRALLKKLGF